MRAATLAAGLLALPAVLCGQQVQTAVVPKDITVGDVFQVVIRVAPVSAGAVTFPDSLALPPDLESAGHRRVRIDTVAAGVRWTAVYPVTGWRPGAHQLSPAPVTWSSAGSGAAAEAAFPDVAIRSVLPADTAGVQPKPARDVLGGTRVWWPWLLLAAAVFATALAALYWYRRRTGRAAPPALVPAVSARDAALAALERARVSGALDGGDYKRFYSDVSGALRAYLAAVDAVLGTDLTTSELVAAMRGQGWGPGSAELNALLRAADLVKFARREPGREQALAEWERTRAWVEAEPGASVARAA